MRDRVYRVLTVILLGMAVFFGILAYREHKPFLEAKISHEAIKKTADSPGWLPAANVLFGSGQVRVIRRNCLGEERYRSSASLPVSMMLE